MVRFLLYLTWIQKIQPRFPFMKLLVAEDSPSMRKVVVRMLKSMGYDHVEESPDGADAWDKIRSDKIDLLLTDFNMPRMSGLELTQHVRGNYTAAQLPILMFTTRNQRADIIAAVKAGVNAYIAKPFNAVQLRYHLDRVLEKYARSDLRTKAIHILEGSEKPHHQDDFPIALIAEKAATIETLTQLTNRPYTELLDRIVQRIDAVNESADAPELSYYIDSDSHQIVRYTRMYRERLKMVLVSNDIPGGGLTLARLARVNQSPDFVVALIVNAATELPIQARASLEKLGVLLLLRDHLDDAFLSRLFREEIQSRLHIVPQESLTPQAILQRIETDISLMTSLPVLPGVYHRIMRLSRDRESPIQDWIAAVETDPMSSAMLIRRANSPIYGLKSKVVDAAKAVTMLGKDTVKELVVADALKRSFSDVQEDNFSIEEYWAHSLATAMIARVLSFPLDREKWSSEQQKDFASFGLSDTTVEYMGALRLDRVFWIQEGEDPFVSGMMHDIGKVALVHCYPGLYQGFVSLLKESDWKMSMREAEQTTAGVDHLQVGGLLANNWELTESLQSVIARHHTPNDTDALAHLISLSSFIASAFYSYPAKADTPLKRAMEPVATESGGSQMALAEEDGETMEQIATGLAENTLPFTGSSLNQILQLGFVLGPDICTQLEEIRASMKD
jgi:two-component system, chemotaxis family, chemotaxis protein CheY